MKGTIQYMNPRNGLVAVLTFEHRFTVFELLSGLAEVGDLVSWVQPYPEGIRTVHNQAKDCLLRALFMHHDVHVDKLGKLMDMS